jgi:hypothetical protein
MGLTAAADRWLSRDDRATHPSRGTAATAYALSHVCAPFDSPRPGVSPRRDAGGGRRACAAFLLWSGLP